MMPTTSPSCSVCGRKNASSLAGGRCPYCLLQLGLSSGGAPGSASRFSSTSLGQSADSRVRVATRFMREGVLPKFGDYELLSEIARGGMGVVYRARQKSLNRLVAIKMVLAGQLATPESLQRFRLEAEAAARLHHPGIVPIYEIGEYETQHFFSMELIDGGSLAECLPEFSLDPQASPAVRREQQTCIAELLVRVARALDFAHQHGVLHRDLKPSNILIDQQGIPHLTDFGLAKLTGRESSGLTLSHAVLGTPGYLAPEQAAGSVDVTTAADIYGLGATLYELLTGRPPFVGANAMETMLMAIGHEPQRPRQFNPNIHRDLETIALRCLEKVPEQRYASAAAVADELERFLRHEPIVARPVGSAERVWRWCRRKPALASLVGALILTFVMGSSIALWQWSRAKQANVRLTQSVENLQWAAIDEMVKTRQASRALAKVASMLRESPRDWKAAMFGMSVMEQHGFPVPASPPIRHPQGTELTVARLSPDGKLIVTASFDGTARFWDSTTSEPVGSPLQHEATVTWAEFNPEGSLLATCSEDRVVRLWDVASGNIVGQPLTHEEGVVGAYFSGDGNSLLTRTPRTVAVYDVPTQKRRLGPVSHDARVAAAKFTADCRIVFIARQAGENSLVQLWKLETGELEKELRTGTLADADISSDGSRIVTILDQRGHVWDVASGQKIQSFDSRNGRMGRVAFSPRGENIAAIGLDHWVRVWDAAAGTPITPEMPHYYLLNGLRFLDSGDRLITWGDDALMQIWDVETGENYAEPMRHPHRVVYAESGIVNHQEVFLTARSHLKSRSKSVGTGAAQIWRIRKKRELVTRSKYDDPYGYDGSILSADGKLLALGATNQQVSVMRTDTGAEVCGSLTVRGGPWGILFTPDAKRLVTTTSRGQVTVWSIPDGKPLFEPVELPTTIQPVDITKDGQRFATGSTDGFVRVWSIVTGRPMWEGEHGSEINSLAFSANGQLLASAGEDRVVRVWQVESGQLVHELRGHQNEVMRVSFSTDQRRLVSASLDFTARIWDVASGQQQLVLPHQGEVLDTAFSPDGRYVATGSRDRTAVVWDAATGLPHRGSLLHEQGIRNLSFTADGQRLFTLDFHGIRWWDVASGHPLTVHLPHHMHGGTGFQSISTSPNLTPDGNTAFVATDSSAAHLWHAPVPPPHIPPWFADFLEAVAGQRYVQGTDIPELVTPESFLTLQQQLMASAETDFYTRWAQDWLKGIRPAD